MTQGRDVVVFDVDGTLIDSTYHHALAWQRAFDRLGHPLPLWQIHRSVGMGGDRLVAAVAGDQVEKRHGDELRDYWRQEYLPIRHETFPLPGATDLVQELVSRGFAVALASSGDPQFAAEAIATLGLRGQLAAVTTAADAGEGESKPAPHLIVRALEQVGDVARAVVVGDTPHDVEAATAAGLHCVGLRSGGYCDAELVGVGVARVADDPSALLGYDWEPLLSVPQAPRG